MTAARAELEDLRLTVATACRILGHSGVAREITGHVSARIPGSPDEMLIRCRTEDERGMAATSIDAIRLVSCATGEIDDPAAADLPVELPIHIGLLNARPEVAAVVHVHPKYCVLCGLAGLPLRPIFGAYDHHATVLVDGGVPVFDNSLLVRDDSAATALVTAMGSASACLMRGHGITVVGSSVEQATLRAVRMEHLAEMTWELRTAGYDPALPASELAEFRATRTTPILPKGERWAWNYYAAAAERGLNELH